MYFKTGLLISSITLGYFYVSSPQIIEVPETFEPNYLLTVELLKSRVVNNNHIGDDWSFNSKFEGETLSKGDVYNIDLTGKSKIIINSEAVEEDPNNNDVGSKKLIITPENLKELINQGTLTSIVQVNEHHGPSAGNTATCEFIYKIKLDSIN